MRSKILNILRERAPEPVSGEECRPVRSSQNGILEKQSGLKNKL